MPPRAAKDIPSYIDQMEGKLKNMEIEMQERIEQKRKEQELYEARQKAQEEAEKERLRLAKLEKKGKKGMFFKFVQYPDAKIKINL